MGPSTIGKGEKGRNYKENENSPGRFGRGCLTV